MQFFHQDSIVLFFWTSFFFIKSRYTRFGYRSGLQKLLINWKFSCYLIIRWSHLYNQTLRVHWIVLEFLPFFIIFYINSFNLGRSPCRNYCWSILSPKCLNEKFFLLWSQSEDWNQRIGTVLISNSPWTIAISSVTAILHKGKAPYQKKSILDIEFFPQQI